jgi:hypothetical protein
MKQKNTDERTTIGHERNTEDPSYVTIEVRKT